MGSSLASPSARYPVGSTADTITIVIITYRAHAISSERIIPYGIFLLGFLISPPTAAILVTPAYATKTKAVACATSSHPDPYAPSPKAASQFMGRVKMDQMHRTARKITIITTIGVWIFLILVTPKMLIIVISARRISAASSILMVISRSSSKAHRYALNPIRAKADFNIEAPHSPAPAIVPTNGPKVLSM